MTWLAAGERDYLQACQRSDLPGSKTFPSIVFHLTAAYFYAFTYLTLLFVLCLSGSECGLWKRRFALLLSLTPIPLLSSLLCSCRSLTSTFTTRQ